MSFFLYRRVFGYGVIFMNLYKFIMDEGNLNVYYWLMVK